MQGNYFLSYFRFKSRSIIYRDIHISSFATCKTIKSKYKHLVVVRDPRKVTHLIFITFFIIC